MTFKLPELPYEQTALAPYLSKETFEYHYGKHHKAYVDKLNQLIEGTDFAKSSLEEIVMKAGDKKPIFNNSAQAWNHTFYWLGLTPKKGPIPSGSLKDRLNQDFGSIENFKKAFVDAGVGQFGSGWVWLVQNQAASGKLEIVATSNAANPMTEGKIPLVTCDVWEHAYYIDYRNLRQKFLEGFFDYVNWDFVQKNLESKQPANLSRLMGK